MKTLILTLAILLSSNSFTFAAGKMSTPIVTIESDYFLDPTTANLRVRYGAADEITGLYYWKSNGIILDYTLEEWKTPRDLLQREKAARMSAQAVSANEVQLTLTYAMAEVDDKPVYRTAHYFIRHSSAGFQLFDPKGKLVKKIVAQVSTSWGLPTGIKALKSQ